MIRTLVLLVSALSLAGAQEPDWKIDPVHSGASFSVRHMMISTVRGQFGGVQGTVFYDPSHPEQARVEATIDCSTLNTGSAKRDADLKGSEFFDVKRFPLMKFKSKTVQASGRGKLKVTGDLTINDVTKEVALDVEVPTPPVKDTQGRERVGVGATTKINRKEFGIMYNALLETGGVVVSDEVAIVLDIELIRTAK